jgi:hypothetical protein
MDRCKAISTHMSSTEKLYRGHDTLLKDEEQFRYRSIVSGLQYLTMTRSDLAFAVNRVCQYIQSPRDAHWASVKRILRFIKGTVNQGLLIQRSRTIMLSGFSDADWAACPDDRCSTKLLIMRQRTHRNRCSFGVWAPRKTAGSCACRCGGVPE